MRSVKESWNLKKFERKKKKKPDGRGLSKGENVNRDQFLIKTC